ncbi:hypothetical protein RRG08_017220 [Elysia crispata]|uniref:Uncharacterized protein n=1 Tax=Elysia crispata TaxID=231223 RepID=A0AAE1CQN2_9GAST|nr:hypothetical protein RRG08_017220 [Elysia crispata]
MKNRAFEYFAEKCPFQNNKEGTTFTGFLRFRTILRTKGKQNNFDERPSRIAEKSLKLLRMSSVNGILVLIDRISILCVRMAHMSLGEEETPSGENGTHTK